MQRGYNQAVIWWTWYGMLLLVAVGGLSASFLVDPAFLARKVSADGHLGGQTALVFQVLRIACGFNGFIAMCAIIASLPRKELDLKRPLIMVVYVIYALISFLLFGGMAEDRATQSSGRLLEFKRVTRVLFVVYLLILAPFAIVTILLLWR